MRVHICVCAHVHNVCVQLSVAVLSQFSVQCVYVCKCLCVCVCVCAQLSMSPSQEAFSHTNKLTSAIKAFLSLSDYPSSPQ